MTGQPFVLDLRDTLDVDNVAPVKLYDGVVCQWLNHLHNESWNVTLGIDGVTLHAH